MMKMIESSSKKDSANACLLSGVSGYGADVLICVPKSGSPWRRMFRSSVMAVRLLGTFADAKLYRLWRDILRSIHTAQGMQI